MPWQVMPLLASVFRGKNFLFLLFLATMMIPFQVIMVPLYLEVYYIGWLNSFWGLIVPKIASAYWIFLCRSASEGLPKDLEDAARIDGMNEFGIFTRIMLPLITPTMITVLLLSINNCWNDLLWPMIVASKSSMRTLSNGLAIFIGNPHGQLQLSLYRGRCFHDSHADSISVRPEILCGRAGDLRH